jgi:hypothetical protein
MANDWIGPRIAEARAGIELIGDASIATFESLLVGKFQEKELRPKEVSDLAKSILKEFLDDGEKK